MNSTNRLALGCVVIAALHAVVAFGQDPAVPLDGTRISRIEFNGLDQVSISYCRSQIVTSVGQPYVDQTVAEDRRRLIRTGKFLDVTSVASIETDRVVLVFNLEERPSIENIRFVGNVRYDDKQLGQQLDLQIGDPLNRFRVELGARAIEQLYESGGFGEASARIDGEALQQRRVVYLIEEGPRIKLRDIAFEGNTAFGERALRARIRTATYLPVFRTGDFSSQRAERDTSELQNYYRDRGYLDARVGYRTAALNASGDMTVTFVIDEGDHYHVNSVQFEGNVAVGDEALLAASALHPGAVMTQAALNESIAAVRDSFGAIGYLYAVVEASRAFTEDPGQVNLTFVITEGQPYRVGRIVPRGNEMTQDRVVRRQLQFFPGELFDTTAMAASEAGIRSTGLFSKAAITPVGDDPEVRDVLIDLIESERTINFLFGGGVGSNSGLGGSITFESRNFDLVDKPVSWSEFIRARAFRGAGQYFKMELAPGTDISSFRIVFREPYLMDRPLSLGTNFYLFTRGRDDWDEERLGTVISLGKTIENGFFEGWSGEIAFRLEDIQIESDEDWWDPTTYAADDIADVEGHNLLTSLKGRLVRNTTDSALMPTQGDVMSLSFEQAIGDHNFTKLETSYSWFKTVRIDDEDRRSIVALKGELGYIVGDVPVFESYYAGGIGSMRGFEFRGVTPRDGPYFNDDQGIGGKFKALAGAEYSFPLFAKTFRGVVFSDMGTVEEDFELTQWRASVGVGLRVTIEAVTPIPFEFNLAFPVAKDEDDDTQVFSFALGISV
jgi:outer membrane protein insertion porin family